MIEARSDASGSLARRATAGGARFVRLPPGRRNVFVPTSSRRAAQAGIALMPATHRRMLGYQRMLWHVVRVAGPRALPGRRTAWIPPVEPAEWSELEMTWRSEVGDFDSMAVYERPQAMRTGFGITLLSRGTAVAFVKLRTDAAALARELAVLDALAARVARGFATVRPLASGDASGWHWLATSPVEPAMSRDVRAFDIAATARDIQCELASFLPPSAPAPAHWQPMHGDLVPWNMRFTRDGTMWLLDWEDASWAPPGADAVHAAAAWAVLFGTPEPDGPDETLDFWIDRIRARPDAEESFSRSMIRVLERKRRGPAR